MDFNIKIGDLEEAQKVETARVGSEALGVKVEKMPEEMAKAYGLQDAKGVIIKEVLPGSPAAGAGLEKGDVILRVGNREVKEPKDLNDLIAEAVAEGQVLLLVRDVRTGNIWYLMVPLQ